MTARILLSAVAATCLLLPAHVRADVTEFGAQKAEFYTQGADDTASYTNDSIFAFVDTTSSSDATSFTLTSSAGGSTPTETLSLGTSGQYGGGDFFASDTALDAAFPVGSNYIFTAMGSTLDGETDTLLVTADNYLGALVLTGTSYDNAQNIDSNSGIDLTYGALGGGTNSSSTGVSLTITDSSNNVVYYANGADTGDFLIPGDTLMAGQTYSAQLANFNVTTGVDVTGDFTGANTSDGFVTSTDFSLSTAAPEPPSLALMGAAGICLVVFLRKTVRA